MKAQERRRAEHEQAWRAVLATSAGRRVLIDIAENMAGVHGGNEHLEALGMARREGKRDVGIELRSRIQKLEPMEWVRALAEELDRRRLAQEEDKREAEEREE